jgi:hypothetical protein
MLRSLGNSEDYSPCRVLGEPESERGLLMAADKADMRIKAFESKVKELEHRVDDLATEYRRDKRRDK